jgi:hypothetical protein
MRFHPHVKAALKVDAASRNHQSKLENHRFFSVPLRLCGEKLLRRLGFPKRSGKLPACGPGISGGGKF